MTTHPATIFQHASPDSPARVHYMQALLRQDYARALGPLHTAIADNDARAMGLLGTLYMLGHGVTQDAQTAYGWFRHGAVRGDLPSQTALGLCLASGRGTALNRPEAVFWLGHAARAGVTVARETLDWLLRQHPDLVGEHVAHDQLSAVVRPTPAGPAARRAYGWAACVSAKRHRQGG
ncbi:MAG: sel1 repeat family protein [Rhodocyclaceae bacterium]|nr:sel1 repeat family protein [Rhodocyclaceae bacterium]